MIANIFLCIVGIMSCTGQKQSNTKKADTIALAPCPVFVSDSAMQYVKDQCSFGPRLPESEASAQCGDYIMEKFERIVKNTAAAYGATATIEYQYVAWPLINEEEPSQVGVEAVVAVLGEDALAPMEKIMAGEDFATYQLDKLSSFAFVGIANPEVGAVYAHHNNNFNMDDSVLADASAVYAEFALRWLDKHANEDPSAQ